MLVDLSLDLNYCIVKNNNLKNICLQECPLKGAVSRENRNRFFHQSIPLGSLIKRLEYLRVLLRIRRDIRKYV
jgi:hypothetical protein